VEKAASWTAAQRDQFASCMATAPICYQTLDSCLR
jgi:hypothetical protein